ncbi:MAG TPA: hypothetical protein DHW76_06510, partial [Clostridiaceae bacterium]|nr:hypothetical protein [Clostridiaceae bacterium]
KPSTPAKRKVRCFKELRHLFILLKNHISLSFGCKLGVKILSANRKLKVESICTDKTKVRIKILQA